MKKIFFILLLLILVSCKPTELPDVETFDETGAGELHIFPIIYVPARPINGVEIWGGSGDSPQVYNLYGNSKIVKEPLLWSTVEPNRGDRLWDVRIDRDVKFHRSIGITPFLTIKYVPNWARSDKDTLCSEAEDIYLDDFAIFLKDVASRYQGKIYIEIGNEPDAPNGQYYWYGCWLDYSDPYHGGDHYRQLLEKAYPLIKQANPEAVVVAGALMLDCPTCARSDWVIPWITESNYDAVSFHSYTYDSTDKFLQSQISFLRQYTDKPLYITETALLANVCDSNYDKLSVEWANKIKNYPSVDMVIWYTLTPTNWLCAGLVDSDWNKKPVYYEWMKGE